MHLVIIYYNKIAPIIELPKAASEKENSNENTQ